MENHTCYVEKVQTNICVYMITTWPGCLPSLVWKYFNHINDCIDECMIG